jgi:drug/metabolite transporter (DMT)-like permease
MIQAFLAAIGYAGGMTIDKIVLCREKLPFKKYMPLIFVFLAFISAFFIPALGNIDVSKFNLFYGFIFLLMIVVAITYNIYSTRGLLKEDLHEYELIMLLSPLVTVILAAMFLPSERNWNIFLPAVIASIAFIVSKFKRHHVRLSVAAKGTVFAMLLMSFESILIKELLVMFSPVALYFVRTVLIALVYLIIYRPKLTNLPIKSAFLVFASALFGVMQMVLKFYGFKTMGVIETSMILLLGPIFVYVFSYFYFNEKKFAFREVACTAVILGCIIYSTVLK